ncbi:outer membrane protein assembly factor BamB [Idiomarina sp. HP20-50]|uniref:outer membrane protein assembly factor BamB n=1 Tax=Idiomarina sp. HP20-50 TaxID=3070813 RepID=UPI00294B0CBC|nr:outer membrane protein assembly factor BamB [Idiomarina sp. HP20-50]MDV6315762.1 outer membrane protein assembly factor BamB [Idiomarina sp. HP20-50]
MQLIKRFTKGSLLFTAAVLISGCSIFGDEEEPKFAELQPINEEVQPKVLWDASVGDGIGDYFSRLNPVVEYGKVFAADRSGIVRAFDKKTGEPIWRIDLRTLIEFDAAKDESWFSGIFSSPFPARISGGLVASYDRIFLGTENGDVVALDEKTGELVWHAEVNNEVMSDPAVGEGRVVVHTSGGKVISLNAETGEQQWEYQYQAPMLTVRGASAPAIISGGVVVGDSNGVGMVLIAENGQQAWTQKVGEPSGSTELERLADIDAKPAIDGRTVYMIAFNGELVALELMNGEVRWKRDYKSFENLLVANGKIFLTDVNSHVYALGQEAGIELWSNTALFGRELSAPALQSGNVVVGDFEGYLHWLDSDSGNITGRYEAGGDGVYAAPVVDNNILYVQTRDGDIIALDIQSGN